MSTLHRALCKEIETHRIDDETRYGSGTSSGTASGNWFESWLHYYQSRAQAGRRHTYSVSKSIDTIPVGHSYIPLEKHPPKPARKRYAKSLTAASLDRTGNSSDSGQSKVGTKVLMSGWLHKTTRLKTSKTRGSTRGHRQHRKFKLTAHSLEYSNLLQKVCICIATYIRAIC